MNRPKPIAGWGVCLCAAQYSAALLGECQDEGEMRAFLRPPRQNQIEKRTAPSAYGSSPALW